MLKLKIKNKALALIFVFLFASNSIFAFAQTQENSELESIISNVAKSNNCHSAQELLDGEFSNNINCGGEWYALALSQLDNYSFTKYENSLLKYLKNNTVYSKVTMQKYALALVACGSTDGYINSVMNTTVGQGGLMSYVFGLHLFNNGYLSNQTTKQKTIESILNLQLKDGGWAISGKFSDIDSSAMVLQALALNNNTKKVNNAINKALNFISKNQCSSGAFKSIGIENCESTAQVLIALSCLNIDYKNDHRFIKNGNTVYDGLIQFKLQDGYMHKQGENTSKIATEQAFLAYSSYVRMQNNKSSIFLLDNRNPQPQVNFSPAKNTSSVKKTASTANKPIIQNKKPINRSDNTKATNSKYKTNKAQNSMPQKASKTESTSFAVTSSNAASSTYSKSENTVVNNKSVGYKIYAFIILLVLIILTFVLLLVFKKFNLKNIIFVVISSIIVSLLIFFTDFSSKENYYKKDVADYKFYATISINCESIKDKINSDGIIIENAKVGFNNNETVYDVLIKCAKQNNIKVVNKGKNYISGIDNIYEYQYGELSGWTYYVNGKMPGIGCNDYILKDGDTVLFKYTLTAGK